MGVPAFFRWLREKYRGIATYPIEEESKEIDGTLIPVDSSQPNPNGVEYDNLYLDMNEIVHPCTHPSDRPQPRNEDEMMLAIFSYVDRVFRLIRPRKLLYMAVDGVAPRAKMNQQRSRRFRAAKENAEKRKSVAIFRQELERQGLQVLPPKSEEEIFDTNVISPGTIFMKKLSKCLRYFIRQRVNNDPGWKNIQVILSDANVPGEGEHKIIDFIRRQRARPGHDPKTSHVIFGADADLIMLGLATHEVNITIIREDYNPYAPPIITCELCGRCDHPYQQCKGLSQMELNSSKKPMPICEREFLLVHLKILREHLEQEFQMANFPFEFDFERILDDWVFMCFFVGNDFLPHLPSLEINEGAIDRLIGLYKKTLSRSDGDYLTENGRVNLTRVQIILTELGEQEEEIFKKRQMEQMRLMQREKDSQKWFKPCVPVQSATFASMSSGIRAEKSLQGPQKRDVELPSLDKENHGTKRKFDEMDEKNESPKDEIRLGDEGWKERYYQVKFNVSAKNSEFRHRVANAYAEGLCWVMLYYHQGCPSWKWYYPFHYAPFASDFLNLGNLKIKFDKSQPFLPFEQTMAIFPAASRRHLPVKFADLMVNPKSPIIDFYPKDFVVDSNGKPHGWQAIAVLPFVDEFRLLKAISFVEPTLTVEEKARNSVGHSRIYVTRDHKAFDFIVKKCIDLGMNKTDWIELDPELTFGISGSIRADSEDEWFYQSEVISPLEKCSNILGNQVIGALFREPQFPTNFIFSAKLNAPIYLSNAKEFSPSKSDGPNDCLPNRPPIEMIPDIATVVPGISGSEMLRDHFDQCKSQRPQISPLSRNSFAVSPIQFTRMKPSPQPQSLGGTEACAVSNRPVLHTLNSTACSSTIAKMNRPTTRMCPIACLTPYQNKWTIRARCTNKSTVTSFQNLRSTGTLFSVDLTDESGEIKATGFNRECDRFYHVFKCGYVYKISGGTIKPAKRQYTTINNDYELQFTSETIAETCLDTNDINTVPSVQFSFHKLASLPKMLNCKNILGIVDVIGICTSAGDLQEITTKRGDQAKKRDIQLIDETNFKVRLTLWGDKAESFPGKDFPVVAVKGAKLSDFGGVSLSMMTSAVIQVNPEIPDAHRLRNWYNEQGQQSEIQSLESA